MKVLAALESVGYLLKQACNGDMLLFHSTVHNLKLPRDLATPTHAVLPRLVVAGFFQLTKVVLVLLDGSSLATAYSASVSELSPGTEPNLLWEAIPTGWSLPEPAAKVHYASFHNSLFVATTINKEIMIMKTTGGGGGGFGCSIYYPAGSGYPRARGCVLGFQEHKGHLFLVHSFLGRELVVALTENGPCGEQSLSTFPPDVGCSGYCCYPAEYGLWNEPSLTLP